MAIVTVYNRDGTEYGTLDTKQYIFNNDLIGFEPIKLDVKIYPYVKINGQYYVNDGGDFSSKGRTDNSAGMMRASATFIAQETSFLENSTFRTVSDITDGYAQYFHRDFPQTATTKIENYRIQNKQIEGLGYSKNITNTDAFNFSDGQPLVLNNNQNEVSNAWCWAFYPKHEHFVLSSNFNVTVDQAPIHCIAVSDDKVLFYSVDSITSPQKTTFLGYMPLEFLPYLSIIVKHTESINNGFIPIYHTTWMYWFGATWKKPNVALINNYLGGNGDPVPTSLHLHGAKAPENYAWPDGPSEFSLSLNTSVKTINFKLYNGLTLYLSNQQCKINTSLWNWSDLVAFGNSNLIHLLKQESFTKRLLFSTSDDSSVSDEDSNNQELFITDIHSMNADSYALDKFHGYAITLSGVDYQIDDGKADWFTTYSGPNHLPVFNQTIKIDGVDASDGVGSSSKPYSGNNINLLNWVQQLNGYNGLTPSWISLLQSSFSSNEESDTGGQFGELEIPSYPNYNGRYAYFKFVKIESGSLVYWNPKTFVSIGGIRIGYSAPVNYGYALIGSLNANDLSFDGGYKISRKNLYSHGHYYTLQYEYKNNDGVHKNLIIYHNDRNGHITTSTFVMGPFETNIVNIESSNTGYLSVGVSIKST